MSLLQADFPSGQSGVYGTDITKILDGLYAQYSDVDIVDDPESLITGNVLRLYGGATLLGGGYYRRVIPAADDNLGLSARFYLTALPQDTLHKLKLFEWRNIDNEVLIHLIVETTGALSWVNSAGTVLATSSPVVVATAWQHIEAFVFLNATVGTAEVRVEGVPVTGMTLTNVDTVGSATPITVAQYTSLTPFANSGGGAYAQTFYMKDFVVWNDSGSINNTFFGSVSVYALLTASDISLNWTPSTGTTGWDLIDESPPVDTDYISAGDPAPAAAAMSLTNLPADVTSVRGLVSIVRAEKTDGGDGNLQVSLTSGANTDAGADRPMTTAFTYWSDVSEVNPGTGVFWTPVEVDAMNIEFDRTV